MWKRARVSNPITGVSVGSGQEKVTHLQFADDTMFFASVDTNKIVNLRILLRLLEAVTGLKINFLKSELVGINIREEDKNLI